MFLRIYKRLTERRMRSWRRLMERHYEEVQAMYQQMRIWRHDYKNHLQVMKAHLDMGEYQKLNDYIMRLDQELGSAGKIIDTGNQVLDASLNSLITMAEAKQIEVDVKVVLPPELSVDEYDLCVLLGNLLNNAVEGCESQREGERRFLRIYIGLLREQFYVSVTNSHAVSVQKEGERYRSTKAGDRGLGMMSIDHVVAKYHGHINRKNDESIFATEVMLPL